MADSRYEAIKRYRKSPWRLDNRVIQFLLCVIAGFFFTWLASDSTFTDSQTYTLFILFFAIALWITEAIPPFAVGILVIGFLVYTLGSSYLNSDPMEVMIYVNSWSSEVIWLMMGGFFLAEGMRRSRLDYALFRLTANMFGSKPKRLLMGLMLTTMVSSMVMSNTATTAMMIAAIAPFLASLDKRAPFSKALLLGIPSAAAIGGMGTIIGSPPNAIATGALESVGQRMDFVQWMAFGLLPALLLTYIMWVALLKKYPPAVKNLDLSFITSQKEHRPTSLKQSQRMVLISLAVTVTFWMTSPIHKIPSSAIAGIPIMMLTITGILKGKDIRRLPWDTLMLVAGGLALGQALLDTGLAEHFVGQLPIDNLNPFFTALALSLTTMALSNVMSNTATASILIPIALIVMRDDPYLAGVSIGLSASCALLLPVSTPPNAIAFSTGHLQQSDFRFGGILIGLLGPLVVTMWVFFLTRVFG
ncbi:SLC13 family permease [Pontibacter sp. G13]|uniref:SLC13 family permease n=1 Tax=Pontibacter sp. G13 TaxID=3074898 RepID=UPI002889CC51|nr:SLC13 family permease [Pontibacter sp. G13]WNJ19204.1 SLC13 family permease [Pontibacter sp. G13]